MGIFMTAAELTEYGLTAWGSALRMCLSLILLTDKRLIIRLLDPDKRVRAGRPYGVLEDESTGQRWVALDDIVEAETQWPDTWFDAPVSDTEVQRVGGWIHISTDGNGLQGPDWPALDVGSAPYLAEASGFTQGLMVGLTDWTLVSPTGDPPTSDWFIHALHTVGVPGVAPNPQDAPMGHWRPMADRIRD